MYKNQKTINQIPILIIGIFTLLSAQISYAQCAMCRASLQGEANVAKAEAVNDGIIYLMVIPYVLVAVMGFFIYKMYRSKK
jgi:heme/copper-type cytochrome/quinol oxidase subunit 2